MQIEEMNLFAKLSQIRKSVEVVQTDKAGYGYRYVTDEALLAKITGGMTKYHVSLVPQIVPGTTHIDKYHYEKLKKGKSGTPDIIEPQNEILVDAEMIYSWVNNDNPDDRIDVPWVMVGQQADASQAFGSALTYSMRYFLLKFFAVATPDDDPDNWRTKQREAEAAEEKELADAIIREFDMEFRGWLASHPDKRDEAVAFFKGFEKSGNYQNITDPRLAAKLRSDFEDKFNRKTEE